MSPVPELDGLQAHFRSVQQTTMIGALRRPPARMDVTDRQQGVWSSHPLPWLSHVLQCKPATMQSMAKA